MTAISENGVHAPRQNKKVIRKNGGKFFKVCCLEVRCRWRMCASGQITGKSSDTFKRGPVGVKFMNRIHKSRDTRRGGYIFLYDSEPKIWTCNRFNAWCHNDWLSDGTKANIYTEVRVHTHTMLL